MVIQECAVDNGFEDTKYKTDTLMSKLKSKVQVTNDEPVGNIIEIDGVHYKVGAGQDDIDPVKTRKQVHRVCTYTAMAQVMKEDMQEFRLVVGQPLMQYANKDLREEFRDYIAVPNSIQTVVYNGHTKKIIIKDILVFAQGAAALYADPARLPEFKKGITAIVDWGSITINGFVCDGLNPIPESMFTENLGTKILYSKIKTAINSKLGYNVQDYEIPYLMRDTPKEMEVTVREVEDEHFEIIKKEMRKRNWSVETIPMFGVGGGFLVTRDVVRKHFDKLDISRNPVYANVIGMYNVGRMVWK